MKFETTPLEGSFLITLDQIRDDRGWFARTYSREEFNEHGLITEWVQMNHSFTANKSTVRGMHYQVPPFREVKLVRCTKGKVFDVIVDIREGSATFLNWFGVELSAKEMNMLYIPEGFAHGFQSVEDDCEMMYMHSVKYQPGSESGIKYNDPLSNIQWPLPIVKISERDNNHPALNASFKGI
jgi:dTDP-4-dehydrorhamnose 3,5-epimerase